MEIKAKAKYVRMSPRKIRLIADVIRKMPVNQAIEQLQFINKKATEPVVKVVKSAIANATNNFELEQDNLFVKEITIDEGPTLHRWMPRAHGRATSIRKKTSHINLVLGEIKESGKAKAKKQAVEAPVRLDNKPKQENEVEIKDKKSKSDKAPQEKTDLDEEKTVKPGDAKKDGRKGHARIEGGSQKGFAGKIFRRKSG